MPDKTKSFACPSCGASFYAEGGEVDADADPSDFPKKDHDLPDYRPPWRQGETAAAEYDAKEKAASEDDEDNRAALAMALKKKRRGW